MLPAGSYAVGHVVAGMGMELEILVISLTVFAVRVWLLVVNAPTFVLLADQLRHGLRLDT